MPFEWMVYYVNELRTLTLIKTYNLKFVVIA